MANKVSVYNPEANEDPNPLDQSFMKGCFAVIAGLIGRVIWFSIWVFIFLAVVIGIPLLGWYLTTKH